MAGNLFYRLLTEDITLALLGWDSPLIKKKQPKAKSFDYL